MVEITSKREGGRVRKLADWNIKFTTKREMGEGRRETVHRLVKFSSECQMSKIGRKRINRPVKIVSQKIKEGRREMIDRDIKV